MPSAQQNRPLISGLPVNSRYNTILPRVPTHVITIYCYIADVSIHVRQFTEYDIVLCGLFMAEGDIALAPPTTAVIASITSLLYIILTDNNTKAKLYKTLYLSNNVSLCSDSV